MAGGKPDLPTRITSRIRLEAEGQASYDNLLESLALNNFSREFGDCTARRCCLRGRAG